MASNNQKKICLLGVFGVGKTSFVQQFVYNKFSEAYLSTIGVKIMKKEMPPVTADKNGKSVAYDFLIWDIEGVNQSWETPDSYYLGASGAIVVADLLREDTVRDLPKIIERFRKVSPQAPIVLAGNKKDLLGENSKTEKAFAKLAEKENLPGFFTSAKTNENVQESFTTLANLIAQKNV